MCATRLASPWAVLCGAAGHKKVCKLLLEKYAHLGQPISAQHLLLAIARKKEQERGKKATSKVWPSPPPPQVVKLLGCVPPWGVCCSPRRCWCTRPGAFLCAFDYQVRSFAGKVVNLLGSVHAFQGDPPDRKSGAGVGGTGASKTSMVRVHMHISFFRCPTPLHAVLVHAVGRHAR